MTSAEARAGLASLLDAAPEPFPFDRAALLLAADAFRGLELRQYEERLDRYASRVETEAGGSAEAVPRLGALRRVLFEDEGFHGNRDEYYDVRNSYLHEVLDRKLGIPISLATVVLGVARRLGWPVAPVSFPAHVLVRYAAPGELLAVDPFHGGLILGPDELEERWRSVTGQPAPPVEQMLRPAPPRAVLVRMVNNIRIVHHHRREYVEAAAAMERLVLLEPAAAHHDRDAGYYRLAAGQTREAVGHLERYLQLSGEAPDAEQVRDRLARLYEDLP